MAGDETLGVTHPDSAEGRRAVRRRRILYATTTVALCAIAILAVLDSRSAVFGVDSRTSSARAADGAVLRVEFPSLTRPALASPLAIEVERPGGFTEPIEIAVSRPWIEVWDENGFYPTPSAETGDPDWIVWEFDPPDGEVFRFFYDARLEPGRQTAIDGRVELRDGATVLAAVDLDTAVRP